MKYALPVRVWNKTTVSAVASNTMTIELGRKQRIHHAAMSLRESIISAVVVVGVLIVQIHPTTLLDHASNDGFAV